MDVIIRRAGAAIFRLLKTQTAAYTAEYAKGMSFTAKCTLCGQCIINCPRGLIRKSGEWIDSDALAAHLLKFSPILKKSGGGLTFSGGEVLSQPDFLLELLDKTASMHRIVETSGFGNTKKWRVCSKLSILCIMI